MEPTGHATLFTTFNKKTGLVTFNSAKVTFEVPFSSIRFVSNRISTGRGMNSHLVSVYSVTEKPLFPGQKITNPEVNTIQYETLLCAYRCHTEEEVNESIKQLRRFMGELPPEPEEPEGPSKFDTLTN